MDAVSAMQIAMDSIIAIAIFMILYTISPKEDFEQAFRWDD